MLSLKLLILLSIFSTVILGHRHGKNHRSSSSSSSSSEEDRRHGRIHVHKSKNRRLGGSKRVGLGADFWPPKPVNDVPATTKMTTLAPPIPKCQPGWTMHQRDIGPWCVKVDYLPGDHKHAENYCKSVGATLTGIHSPTERMRIADEGLKIITKLGHKVGGIWLGAQSVEGCHKDSGKCGPTKSFEWTDNWTKGTDGFKWGKKEPDNTFWGKPACVQQVIISPDYHGKQYSNFEHGDFDKFCCEHEKEPVVKLYACGKKVDWIPAALFAAHMA